jgi:hypothetical protein
MYVRATIVAEEKQYFMFSMCVCSPTSAACAVLYSRMWSVCLYHIFPHYPINGTIFGKKGVIEHKTCFDFLYNFCLKHFAFQEELSEIWTKTCIRLHVKYLLFWSDFNETWVFSTDFRKNIQISISWKSVQWGPTCSMWTDRRTRRT